MKKQLLNTILRLNDSQDYFSVNNPVYLVINKNRVQTLIAENYKSLGL